MGSESDCPRIEGGRHAAAGDWPAVVELRRYRLHPGKRETLIDLFDREFVETQESVGISVIGQFRDIDAPDEFVWLRGFADMPSRAASLQAFYTGPVWAAHRESANGTMVNSDNVLLLRPAPSQARPPVLAAGRPGTGCERSPSGLVVSTICYLAPRAEESFASFFEESVRPVLERASARILGTFVTERSTNTFPRLPVREGETVFVWLSSFPDLPAYEAHRAALSGVEPWTRNALPEMNRRIWRPNEVSRLTPTARSLLPA